MQVFEFTSFPNSVTNTPYGEQVMLGLAKFIYIYSLVNDAYEQTHILDAGSRVLRFYLSSNIVIAPLRNGMVKVYNNSNYDLVQTLVSASIISVASSSKD